MSATTMKKATSMNRMFALAAMSAPLFAAMSHAAAPGITGTGTTAVFNLTAQTAGLNQPDGSALYSWGYGCATGSTPTFAPANMPGSCPTMQVPGPTLIVTEGQTVTVNGYPFTIVGVLTPQYRFWLPQQLFYDDESRDIDAYIPIPRSTLDVSFMGRSA